MVIRGHLAASEDLTIHGSFDGTIEVRDHSVTVGHHAHISGPILAKSIFIEGTVDGDVTATCKVEIETPDSSAVTSLALDWRSLTERKSTGG